MIDRFPHDFTVKTKISLRAKAFKLLSERYIPKCTQCWIQVETNHIPLLFNHSGNGWAFECTHCYRFQIFGRTLRTFRQGNINSNTMSE